MSFADGRQPAERTDPFSLSSRVALITGSTRGIGRAIAEGFVDAGARVYIHGRGAPNGEELAESIGARFLAADLERPEEIERLASDLRAAEPYLNILVNNAGIEIGANLERLEPDVLARVMQVNFNAPVQLTRLLLPSLIAAPSAAVINVTSIHDSIPYFGNGAYTAAKAALAMFTKTAAIELGPEGIRVNTLAPGAVETDINRDVLDQIGRDRFQEWIPLGRTARTCELVGPAVFLASDAASYVNGATLIVDGGYSHNLVRYRLGVE